MPNIALSDARVKALQPRPSAYDIRDAKLRGFGVRGAALRRQALLHPYPASRTTHLENRR